MAQRDYEEQPEAPDLGAAIQLETSESLVGPAGDRDGLDASYVPPDRPYVLDDRDVTAAGQRERDTLDERLAREEPEVPSRADVDRAGRLADQEQYGTVERYDAVDGQDVGISGGAASAEEAAVHIVELGVEPDALADDEGGQPPVDDEVAAESLTADPYADDARVDAARDLRATDEGSSQRREDPEMGPVDDEVSPARGGGLDGTQPDPAYPHGGEPDPARHRY